MRIRVPFIEKPVGAGDIVRPAAELVRSALSNLGLKLESKSCGCARRRRRMNQKLVFVPRKAPARPPIPRSVREIPNFGEWTEPPHMPAAWSRGPAGRNPRTGTDVAMFTHTSGRIMIWEIIGGAYRRSHGFCCSSLKLKAEQRFAELCQ
jgi:hypothetical protein